MSPTPSVIVTGASRGVGAAVARWLGSQGVSVSLVARNQDALESVASEVRKLGGTAFAIEADVADPDACCDIVKKTIDRFQGLSGLVNNAGILMPMEKVALSGTDDWRYNIEVNLLGPVYLSMTAIPALRQNHGRIINVSSGAAYHVIAAASAYCAAKAGLNQFSRVLAAEEPELTVIAVRPGVVDTQMQRLLRKLGPEKMPPEQADYYVNLKATGQLEPAAVPGRSIAWMVLYAPRDWSGAFMSYDEPQVSEPALAVFGERPN